MTAVHFEYLAACLASAAESIGLDDSTLDALSNSIGKELEDTNQGFIREKFIKSCFMRRKGKTWEGF